MTKKKAFLKICDIIAKGKRKRLDEECRVTTKKHREKIPKKRYSTTENLLRKGEQWGYVPTIR